MREAPAQARRESYSRAEGYERKTPPFIPMADNIHSQTSRDIQLGGHSLRPLSVVAEHFEHRRVITAHPPFKDNSYTSSCTIEVKNIHYTNKNNSTKTTTPQRTTHQYPALWASSPLYRISLMCVQSPWATSPVRGTASDAFKSPVLPSNWAVLACAEMSAFPLSFGRRLSDPRLLLRSVPLTNCAAPGCSSFSGNSKVSVLARPLGRRLSLLLFLRRSTPSSVRTTYERGCGVGARTVALRFKSVIHTRSPTSNLGSGLARWRWL